MLDKKNQIKQFENDIKFILQYQYLYTDEERFNQLTKLQDRLRKLKESK